MEKEIILKKENDASLQIKILAWFGIVFGSMYLIYAIVNIVLSFLDRTQENFGANFLILLYGIPILAFSLGFMYRQKWGWIGYAVILALIIVLTVTGGMDLYGIIIGFISLTVLIWILTPSIRRQYFTS